MNVLMFGWEFPPLKNGGLGTACEGLAKGLSNKGINLTFVLPTSNSDDMSSPYAKLIVSDRFKNHDINITFIDSILTPYMRPTEYITKIQKINKNSPRGPVKLYGANLFEEIYRYSERAIEIAEDQDYDIIHCHDWVTYPAGIKAKKSINKPLVVHIHATEFDRTGGHPNQVIYNIEREGFHEADKIIAVSEFTKNKVVEHYGVPPEKVEVVHNAINVEDNLPSADFTIEKKDKVVLFIGRITMQKGPEYFLYSAKKVLEHDPNVKFVVAGTGDMENFMIAKARDMGMENNFVFTGFLTGDDINKAYRMADLYVMPSISEPFGLTPLESMMNGTPALISKQSGVSEVVKNCLKVDFWDIDQMTNKIMGVLNYSELKQELKEKGNIEVRNFTWDVPAEKCCNIYNQLTI